MFKSFLSKINSNLQKKNKQNVRYVKMKCDFNFRLKSLLELIVANSLNSYIWCANESKSHEN